MSDYLIFAECFFFYTAGAGILAAGLATWAMVGNNGIIISHRHSVTLTKSSNGNNGKDENRLTISLYSHPE